MADAEIERDLAVLTKRRRPLAKNGAQVWPNSSLFSKMERTFRRGAGRARLIQRMREFSFALGVRCQHCHSGGDGVSMEGVDFASDEKAAKKKARAMLHMTDEINGTLLPRVPARVHPAVGVDCATCHRGLAIPRTLQTTLLDTIAAEGIPAAVPAIASSGRTSFPPASTTSANGR